MRSRLSRLFAVVAAFVGFLGGPAFASTASDWGRSAIVERDGDPVFRVDGKPFFMYGAAFFYERLPRDSWAGSLAALRYGLHINTLDLYVPWNWHELSDGDFDFDGRTNPRRDLRDVLRLAHALGFKLVLRPGPVIRNEWRNGGYPAWLLERPEYGMPARDVSEGRYPATATLQNARSDDAAAQWLGNGTHAAYAARWLERVLREFAPYSGDVLAIALDDDQGAYVDNQTWPAPHLSAYLARLGDVVHRATAPTVPLFINTYEMKVTASSPVWAMGNWYQSEAFAIGEHDRSQLEFSTGLLHTRPHQPMMMSEFQAGWLQQPQDVLPQAADPSNTLLAIHTLLASGVRGLINFPAQDTYAPAGWEAPFSNAFYAWDAALGYDAGTNDRPVAADSVDRAGATRAVPTAYVGGLVETFGPALANARVASDAAIAYLTSAYDPARVSNADVAAIADATIAAQRDCRTAEIVCRLVDLRFAGDAELARYPILLLPSANAHVGAFGTAATEALRRYVRQGGILVRNRGATAIRRALPRTHRTPAVDGAGGATYAEEPGGGAGFLTLENYDGVPKWYPHPTVRRTDGTLVRFAPVAIGSRDALLLPVDVSLHAYAPAFETGDRLESSTCPVVALRPVGARELAITRSPTPGATCTTRFRFGIRRRRHAVSVASRVARFDIGVDGVVTTGGEEPIAPAVTPPRTEFALTLPIRNDLIAEEPIRRGVAVGAVAYFEDVYRDGFPCVVLENAAVRVIVSPFAGGRAFVFEDKARVRNAFDTIGALRDDVAIQPPASETDRIAKYTHQFPAGFFNRPYRATIVTSGPRAVVRLRYDAPDAFPNGGTFEHVLTLEPDARAFTVDASATFAGTDSVALAQRGVLVSSLVAGNPRAASPPIVLPAGVSLADSAAQPIAPLGRAGSNNVAGLFDPASHDLVMQAWSEPVDLSRAGDTRDYARQLTTTVLVGASGTTHVAFAFETAKSLDDARARLQRFGCDTARTGRSGDARLSDCALEGAARDLR